jgi:dinuclear metal center YbgI/SA1388 family protein
MKLKEIISLLDSVIPLSFQESYDNSGLQVGLPDQEIASAIITLDVTEEVVAECICEGCDLIISHHPVIFSPLKRLAGKTLSERVIYQAVKHDIAIYSAHTNLDAASNGVSRKMAEKLGLTEIKVLSPLKNRLLKLVTFVPESHLDGVREAVFDAGAGVIANYDRCGYYTSGTGSFRPGENTRPFTGEKGKFHFEKEVRFETILFSHLRAAVVDALLKSHPYEEVAYDLYPLENDNIDIGFGCIGRLAGPLTVEKFLGTLSAAFDARGIRYSGGAGQEVSRVALCGGSGSGLISEAAAAGADAYVTADLKYHNFLEAGKKLLLVDCGHYETEKYSIEIIHDLIIKKFPTFALRFSKTNSNPINYL